MSAEASTVVQQKFEKLFSFLITKPGQDTTGSELENSETYFSNPFHEVCDPSLFYDGGQHAKAYQNLQSGIRDGLSLLTLTGAVGLGKSMIVRTLSSHLSPAEYTVTTVVSLSKMSPTALLKSILHGYGYRIQIVEKRYASADLFRVLEDFSERMAACHKRLVIFVDEAHLLSSEALKTIKSISCLETQQQKLASCVLVGEPGMEDRLEHPSFASLQSRLYVQTTLTPLCDGEIRQYVAHRLRLSGYHPSLFGSSDTDAIVHACHGNCREINKLGYDIFRSKATEELLRARRTV